MSQKFFKCAHCGNIIAFVEDKGVPVMCCGQKMDEIVPGTTDAAQEKHVPVLRRWKHGDRRGGIGRSSDVGRTLYSVDSIETREGNQRKILKPGEAPKADFCTDGG